MPYHTRYKTSKYKNTAESDIKAILEYISVYLPNRRYSNTPMHDGLLSINNHGNVKTITLKKRGIKHHYRDYKNILHYKENTVESIDLYLHNKNIIIVYRKDECTHYGHMSMDEFKDYMGLDNSVYLTRDLIDRA